METILTALILLGATGLVVGLFIGVASIFFKTEKNEKKEAILKMLPGNNCGGCGYPGCEGLAQAISEGKAPCDACPVGGAPVAQEIGAYLGETVDASVRKVAFVQCGGDEKKAEVDYEYVGLRDCKMAGVLPGGGAKTCNYGCLGLGSCVKACKFDAIHIENGIAVADPKKCTGCGQCVKACPKHLITLIPYNAPVMVLCSSCDKGPDVMKSCKIGCIGCGICKKTCQHDAITIDQFCATIDPKKCVGCGECVEKCPRKVIVFRDQKSR